MNIELCVPENSPVRVDDLIRKLNGSAVSQPFSQAAREFLDRLSNALLHDPLSRTYPELMTLGFWLRRTEIERLRAEFDQLVTRQKRLLPRGTVFQVAPGNVDTLFAYSWTFSVLTGNRSIVRLSSKSTEATAVICAHLAKLLPEFPELRSSHAFIRYGHDVKITEALSKACDVRIVWGGDASVDSIRQVPIPSHAKELSFRDRYSLCAMSAEQYLAATGDVRQRLVRDFYNDAYWFDQMACSSPRLVIWCGDRSQCERAAAHFYAELENETDRRNYAVDPSVAMRKFVFACEAMSDAIASRCTYRTPAVTVIDLSEFSRFPRQQCGGGFFLQYATLSLSDIAPHLTRRDQTIAHFGFEDKELDSFAGQLPCGAIDRIVPIGQALSFDRYWDGYDFFQELTRSVVIRQANTACSESHVSANRAIRT
jgi:hypothetical protein